MARIINVESLKVDILDKKFAIISFISRLGVQSKDLMFSISKNTQENMAEVLAKAEEYINDEEALLSKQENSAAQKERSRGEKKIRTKPQEARRQGQIPTKRQRETRTIPEEEKECQRPPGTTSARSVATVLTSTIHPPDNLSVTGLA